jgi:hypothetical protein
MAEPEPEPVAEALGSAVGKERLNAVAETEELCLDGLKADGRREKDVS